MEPISFAPTERPTRFNKSDLIQLINHLGDKVRFLIKMAVNEAKRDNLDVLETFGFDKASRMFENMGFPQEMVIDCLISIYDLNNMKQVKQNGKKTEHKN